MKIYIVRHGQTKSNLKEIYDLKDDINETGIEQAKELKEKIQDLEYDVLYCSPLLRARHTAEIINTKNKEMIIDNRLSERDPGDFSGKPYQFMDREEYWNYYSNIQYGTAETMQNLLERVTSFLDELKTKSYKQILIVAHSGISKAFYAYFNGIPRDGKFLDLGLKFGEIREYEL